MKLPTCDDCGNELVKHGTDRSGPEYWCPTCTKRSVAQAAVMTAPRAPLTLSDEQITRHETKMRGTVPAALDEMVVRVCAQAREANELREDAERYRLLNAKDNFLITIDDRPVRLKCGEPLDRWLDGQLLAARSNQRGDSHE